MKILSWNILAEEYIKKIYYKEIPKNILFNRNNRIKSIISVIKKFNCDIITLQEVMLKEFNELKKIFSIEYNIIKGKNINWNGCKGYSGNVTFIKKGTEIMEVIDHDYGVTTIISKNGKKIIVINIHLDDKNQLKRTEEINSLKYLFSDIVIIAGDFNEHFNRKELSKLYKSFKSFKSFEITNNSNTYYLEPMCIDNIIIKGFKTFKTTVINDFKTDYIKQFINYGSDHLPLVGKMKL